MSVFLSLDFKNLLLLKYAKSSVQIPTVNLDVLSSNENKTINIINVDLNDVGRRVFTRNNTYGKLYNQPDYEPHKDYKSIFVMALRLNREFYEDLSSACRHFTVHTSITGNVLITRCDTSDTFIDKSVAITYEQLSLKERSIGDYDDWLFSLDRITFSDKKPQTFSDYTFTGAGTWWRYDSGVVLLGTFNTDPSWYCVYYELHPRYELRLKQPVVSILDQVAGGNPTTRLFADSARDHLSSSAAIVNPWLNRNLSNAYTTTTATNPNFNLFFSLNPQLQSRPLVTASNTDATIPPNVTATADTSSTIFNGGRTNVDGDMRGGAFSMFDQQIVRVECAETKTEQCLPSIDWLTRVSRNVNAKRYDDLC
ncbi:gp23-like protein [Phenacoccus solenopsis nudivirus]|nr:gp23-like protein [Phenacoccus solenopsis nudivirus]